MGGTWKGVWCGGSGIGDVTWIECDNLAGFLLGRGEEISPGGWSLPLLIEILLYLRIQMPKIEQLDWSLR